LKYLFFCGLALASSLAIAAPPSLTLVLEAGVDDLSDALVYLEAEDASPELSPETVEMDQFNRAFSPRAVAVEKGGAVRFLNNDDVQHHVYSFSAPKRFELPLYQGEPPEDIRFDKAGEVVLGCNIHDWMVGWVHVLETPFFDFADSDGQVAIDAPPGQYRMTIWHPEMQGDEKRWVGRIELSEDPKQRVIELAIRQDEDDDLQRRRDRRF